MSDKAPAVDMSGSIDVRGIELPSLLFGSHIITEEAGVSCTTLEELDKWLETPFLEIKLSCGCKVKYDTKADVPRKSVKCEHDNYFVRIENV